jgi:hypothetical protein
MRLLILVICVALVGLSSLKLAASPEASAIETGDGFVAGISPFLDSAVKDTVYRGLVRLMVEDLPLNTQFEIYDAYNLKSITRISIPNSKAFSSPKVRANQFAEAIGELKRFLARDNAKPAGAKPGFEGAIRLPQFCDFLAGNRPRQNQNGIAFLPLLLIGSPLYQDSREPGFSMVDGYYPSDAHLRASRDQSVFGLDPGDAASNRLRVCWAYFGDPWMSDLHREKVTRFWALYLERGGGRLASFSADLATATAAFISPEPIPTAASKGWVADPLQTRPEMLRATRDVAQVDWLINAPPAETSPPPSQLVGPLKIGIRWKENIDLDLYAAARRGAETLFFQHTRSAEGYYFKDHRSSPGHEYEFIEFESPVDARQVMAYVNFYGGSCPGGPRGEVRIEFHNRIYTGTFAIASAEGNQGRSGESQAAFWTRIPVLEILGVTQAASLAR